MKLKEIILLMAIIAGLAFWYYPREGRPPSNTPEHKAAHGVVEGQIAEITVGTTRLRIPPHISFTPRTNQQEIESGKADTILLGLRYPELEQREVLNRVSIELRKGYEAKDTPLPNEPDANVKEISDGGLIEYRRPRDNGGWNYVVYWPKDESARTPLGNRIQYGCRGLPGKEPSSCRCIFVIENDLQVWYYLPRELLPHWQKIHLDVVELVTSIIAQ